MATKLDTSTVDNTEVTRVFSHPKDETPYHSSFHRFSSLPMELRLKIWHQVLSQPRIMALRLRNRIVMDGLLARYGGERTLDREIERYGVVVDGYRAVPCWLLNNMEAHGPMVPFTLRFNLEHDFLWISNDTGQIAEFLHDLKTVHDPQKIGLRNLAMDIDSLTDWGGLTRIEVQELSEPLQTSFIETLSQLREVFFLHLQFGGRHVLGDRSGAPDADYEVNLSLPIKIASPNFRRLDRDPRPIGSGIKRVFLHHDPRIMLHAWGKYFYDQFGGSIVPQADYSVLVSFLPSAFKIYDSQRAIQWLNHEKNAWLGEIQDHQKLTQGQDKANNTIVDSAFGFWLFQPEAFGPLPKSPLEEFTAERAKFWDLTNFWPELCLPDLPENCNGRL